MAAAALEVALTDLELRAKGVSLASHLGGVHDRVPCGVSLGIEGRIEDLLELVTRFLVEGYRRIKLKIEPGRDVEVVRAVRDAFPDAPLSVDANAAYTRETAEALLPLDDLALEYIEQPLPEDDLLGHIELQRRMATSLCLDETVTSARVARGAIELGACRIINVKLGRVGGLAEALRIHDLARDAGVPLWVGGMLETGVGRAANVALASLPGFTLPGDTSASDRYFDRDLTEPFVVGSDGAMAVPDGPGLGVAPQENNLDEEVSVVENLLIYARYFDIPRRVAGPAAEELLRFVALHDKRDWRIDRLSGGMKRRLLIARALINEPELLILDEPTTGLDPQARHVLWDRLYRLKQQGVTQVLTTHYMDEAEQLCDRLVVMDRAKIVAEGSPRELIERYVQREVVEVRFPGEPSVDGKLEGLG